MAFPMVRSERVRRPSTARARASAPWVAVCAALLCCSAAAQSGGGFAITRSTIDNGGGTSTGGIYVLQGTIGQFEAAPPLAGGSWELRPGFWTGSVVDQGVPLPSSIFSDGFED